MFTSSTRHKKPRFKKKNQGHESFLLFFLFLVNARVYNFPNIAIMNVKGNLESWVKNDTPVTALREDDLLTFPYFDFFYHYFNNLYSIFSSFSRLIVMFYCNKMMLFRQPYKVYFSLPPAIFHLFPHFFYAFLCSSLFILRSDRIKFFILCSIVWRKFIGSITTKKRRYNT